MGEGSGHGSGRVGSDFLSAIAGRVGSGRVNVSPGRVGSGPRKVTRGQLWYITYETMLDLPTVKLTPNNSNVVG